MIRAYLPADEGQGMYGEPVVLALSCVSGKVEIYIHWGSYLGYSYYDNGIHVTTRIGDHPAQTLRWEVANDYRATIYQPSLMLETRDGMQEFGQPGALTTSDFIYELKQADRFVAQVTPHQEFPITAVFDLTGIERVTPKVLGQCVAPK
jgi:type VI secretion system protein VasI